MLKNETAIFYSVKLETFEQKYTIFIPVDKPEKLPFECCLHSGVTF